MAKGKSSSDTPATTRCYGVTDATGKERLIEATSNVQAVMHVYGPKVRLVPAIEAVKASRSGIEIEDATADTKQQPLPIDPANAAGQDGAQGGQASNPGEGSGQSEKPSQPAAPAAEAGKGAAPKAAGAGKGAK